MDLTPITRIASILGLLAFVSASELVIPLRRQERSSFGRLRTNLTLTAITLILGIVFNGLLLSGAVFANDYHFGLLPLLNLNGVPALIVTIAILDFSAYLAHVFMHKVPWAWRVHVVHHIDVSVDATTALRQHPLEGLLRFAFLAAAAWSLGAVPEAIAVSRLLSSANAIVEHANIRLPRWLESALLTVWVTPNMHKMHHSSVRADTDSNYSNLFSFFDRLFGTYTRGDRANSVVYGIDGNDKPQRQSLQAVMSAPFAKHRSETLAHIPR
jgi:sterol desaturase/sphingolipid hydroxylase (fatty acid hydroxylase superfamily)